MAMWLRLAAALLVTAIAIGALELFGGAGSMAARTPAEVQEAARGRPRELFWFAIFAVVMATSVLAGARRGLDRLRRVARRHG